jgi:hypothetical protein
MKGIFALLLVVLYLSSALGLDFNIHYCGGKFDSIAFASSDNAGCKCADRNFGYKPGINKKVHSCCRDLHVHSGFSQPFENEIVHEHSAISRIKPFPLFLARKSELIHGLSSGHLPLKGYLFGPVGIAKTEKKRFLTIRVLRL